MYIVIVASTQIDVQAIQTTSIPFILKKIVNII